MLIATLTVLKLGIPGAFQGHCKELLIWRTVKGLVGQGKAEVTWVVQCGEGETER